MKGLIARRSRGSDRRGQPERSAPGLQGVAAERNQPLALCDGDFIALMGVLDYRLHPQQASQWLKELNQGNILGLMQGLLPSAGIDAAPVQLQAHTQVWQEREALAADRLRDYLPLMGTVAAGWNVRPVIGGWPPHIGLRWPNFTVVWMGTMR